MTYTYRTNPDGSAICEHKDMSVCTACATDPELVAVSGAYYHVPDADERAELVAELAEIVATPNHDLRLV